MIPAFFIQLISKLESLATKLPGPLQAPILREIQPIKEIFLLQRTPRLLVLGDRGAGMRDLLAGLAVLPAAAVEVRMGEGDWMTCHFPDGAAVQICEAFEEGGAALGSRLLAQDQLPDAILFLHAKGEIDEEMPARLDRLEALLGTLQSAKAPEVGHSAQANPLPIFGVSVMAGGGDLDVVRAELHAALHSRPTISRHLAATVLARSTADGLNHDDMSAFCGILINALPPEAKLQMARMTGHRAAQADLAQVLVRSATGVCGAIGAQPIPLADFPILTSIQATMVAGIMYVSGRNMDLKLTGEFIGALGANVGMGMILREGSRALLKFIPGWGNAVSGIVAGAGTFAIGKAAVAYFIEGTSLEGARSLFSRLRRRKQDVPRLPNS